MPDGIGHLKGEDIAIYIKQQHQFVKALSSNVRDRIVIRVHPKDYLSGHRQKEQLEGLMLKLRFDENKSLVDSLLKSRLVVLDDFYTVFFEVIAYGIPVIVFYDESMWEFNREFNSICDEMKKLKMLHTSPESIARFLSETIDDIEGWWNASEVQELTERLRKNCARTSHDPERMFANELSRIVAVKN